MLILLIQYISENNKRQIHKGITYHVFCKQNTSVASSLTVLTELNQTESLMLLVAVSSFNLTHINV